MHEIGVVGKIKTSVDGLNSRSFISFFFWGGTRFRCMPALRPASQAAAMRDPREGTSVVLRNTIRLT